MCILNLDWKITILTDSSLHTLFQNIYDFIVTENFISPLHWERAFCNAVKHILGYAQVAVHIMLLRAS